MSQNNQSVRWLPVSFSTSGNQTIVTGVSNQTIRIRSVLLTGASAVALTFLNGAIPITGALSITALAFDLDDKPWVLSPGSSFIISSGGSVDVEGAIAYTQG